VPGAMTRRRDGPQSAIAASRRFEEALLAAIELHDLPAPPDDARGEPSSARLRAARGRRAERLTPRGPAPGSVWRASPRGRPQPCGAAWSQWMFRMTS
jgi:hypothetical protein